MKKPNRIFLSILLIACYCLTCSAQTLYEPQVLILSPKEFTFDQSLQNEVISKTAELKKMLAPARQELLKQRDNMNREPANLKLMQQSSVDFLKQIDFSKQISLFTQQYLTYRFYEKFPNCLILLKDEKSSGNRDSLKQIGIRENTPYVLNFSSLSLYKQKGEIYCKVRMQLYEQASNSLLIDKEYTGDWNNHGFEFTCEQGSIGCTVNNALSFAMPDVILQIASNNPTLKKEKELAKRRRVFISDSIYTNSFNDALIRAVIPSSDTTIELNDIYYCFYNADKSKFVAFFIKTLSKNDAKYLLSEKKDQNVTVITSKDIHDPGYLDQSPKTYGYIVLGVQYQNKWYYNKSEVTYFDAPDLTAGKIEYLNNLQKWNFFVDNTDKPGTEFWEGKLFEKIKDKRKDPDWERYKSIWETEERENRDYIGLYELVANELKKEKDLADDSFRKKLISNVLVPFYGKLVNLKYSHITKTDNPEPYNLIYPKDMSVVVNPIKITDEKGVTSIRYFVVLTQTNEVFEWTLIPPYIMHKNEYTDEPILKAMRALTNWNYSFKTLDDDNFWNEKVLAKEGANYKYLKKIE